MRGTTTGKTGGIPKITAEDYVLDALRRVDKSGVHFNGLFRMLSKRGTIGSPSTLSMTLKKMLKCEIIRVRTKKQPGLQKRVYYLTASGRRKAERLLVFELESDQERKYLAIKKKYGLRDDREMAKLLINQTYEGMFKEKAREDT